VFDLSSLLSVGDGDDLRKSALPRMASVLHAESAI